MMLNLKGCYKKVAFQNVHNWNICLYTCIKNSDIICATHDSWVLLHNVIHDGVISHQSMWSLTNLYKVDT